ncbi:MAG: hypothetical protein ACKOOL_09610 [Novosphingobium sp.]
MPDRTEPSAGTERRGVERSQDRRPYAGEDRRSAERRSSKDRRGVPRP